jgi:hypothetical protein
MSTSSAEIPVVIGENGAGSSMDFLDPLRPLGGGGQVTVSNGRDLLVPEQWRDSIDTAGFWELVRQGAAARRLAQGPSWDAWAVRLRVVLAEAARG